MKLLITGGGTGGHVNPGIAIAKYIKTLRPNTDIRFAGTHNGIENKLVPREGFQLYTIEAAGLRRSLKPKDAIFNIKALHKAYAATGKAIKILKDFQPDAVIGCGGYASYPMVKAAQKLSIPTIILEVNAFPGVVTKSLSKKADRVLVCFEETKKFLGDRSNIYLTGAPIRGDILFAKKQEAREKLKLDDKPLVVSFWGSMGALYMNRHMAKFIERESREDAFRHIHATGASAYKWLPEMVSQLGVNLKEHPNIELREYIYNMADVMAAADLIICRAGAATIGEICALGKPSIMVPSPFVAENHQEKNARALEKEGACIVITEHECDDKKLFNSVKELLSNREKLNTMGKNAAKMAVLDSSEKIYRHILEVSKK